jgi:hypothetical protein
MEYQITLNFYETLKLKIQSIYKFKNMFVFFIFKIFYEFVKIAKIKCWQRSPP